MAGVTDHHHLKAFGGEVLGALVHLRHKGAGNVDDLEAHVLGGLFDFLWHAVRGHHQPAFVNVFDVIDDLHAD